MRRQLAIIAVAALTLWPGAIYYIFAIDDLGRLAVERHYPPTSALYLTWIAVTWSLEAVGWCAASALLLRAVRRLRTALERPIDLATICRPAFPRSTDLSATASRR